MSSRGFFSIVQYCPDLDRGECANVGVVLCVPELGYLGVRMSENNEGPKQRFGATAFDDFQLTAAKAAIEGRLRAEGAAWTEPSQVIDFARREANNLQLTKPRTMLSLSPSEDLAELFYRMVFVERRTKSRVAKPNLKVLLEERAPEVPWLRDVEVELPRLGALKAPYAYRNGALNLIRPESFPMDERVATQRASELAVKSHILHGMPGESRKLIVVGAFDASATQELKERLGFVLAEHEARLVHEAELPEFVEQVKAEAHS